MTQTADEVFESTHMTRSSKKTDGRVPADQELLDGIALEFREAALVCEAMRALWISQGFLQQVWHQLVDIIKSERLDENWGMNADALGSRLATLTRSEATALLRGAIRFWERREEPTATLLLELGLIRPERGNRRVRRSRAVSPR